MDQKDKNITTDKTKTEKTASKAFSVFKYVSRIILDVLIILIIAGTATLAYFYRSISPDLQAFPSQVAQTSVIYDRSGTHVLYEIHGEENRKVIAHSDIPDTIRVATIAAEDNGFYDHSGVDFKAILRALKADVQSNEIQQGGSTITQQLARNVFLSRDKTLKRKISEIILAFKIERSYSKDQILDMYLNEIPYGSNAYGVEAASQTFFGHPAKDLSLDEAAMIAALTNATTYYSPYGNHTDDLVARQQKVLDKIEELKLADKDVVEKAKSENTLAKIVPLKQAIAAPHFVFYIKEQLENKYGQDMVERGGLKIYTTLDWDKQKLAESVIQTQMPAIQTKYGATNAALVSIDPKSGQILAMVGSKNFFDKSIDGQVNVAISPRQPGSSFKPYVYATAFEKGYQPENLIYDVPTDFGPDGSGRDYIPNNYDGRSHGLVSMREALGNSLNIPAVKTLYLAGLQDTINTAHSMGITTLQEPKRYGLALALGGGEVTLLDHTSAFGVFANDGKRNPATGILKIVDSQGNTIDEPQPQNSPVIPTDIARKIDSILSDNQARTMVFGPNTKLVIPGHQVAAKTGTTQEFHDAWTVGFTPSLVTGIWVGNSNNTAMKAGADGSYVAAPIWNAFMTQALTNYPNEKFPDYGDSSSFDTTQSPELKYFNKKTGKEIPVDKLDKTNPDKVEVRMDTSSPSYFSSGKSQIVEMQNTKDPMILRWRAAIQGPMDYNNYYNNFGGFNPNMPPPFSYYSGNGRHP